MSVSNTREESLANQRRAHILRIENQISDTMTHDDISRFFSEEEVKKALQFPDWPAGTEIVCYCRSTDSRDTIEQIARLGQWKIVKFIHIDELPIVQLYKPGQVMFAKREAVKLEYKPTPIELETWRGQMLGGLRVSDWDKFKTNNSKE